MDNIDSLLVRDHVPRIRTAKNAKEAFERLKLEQQACSEFPSNIGLFCGEVGSQLQKTAKGRKEATNASVEWRSTRFQKIGSKR